MRYIVYGLLIIMAAGCTLNVGSFGKLEQEKVHGIKIKDR